MKKIITHINPDLDAVCSVWLIKRFLPGWQEAEVDFCEAGLTFNNEPVDSNPEILHADVGLGKLDHHQKNDYLSASKLCWEYIKEIRKGEEFKNLEKKALERLVEVVTEIDNAGDLSWFEAKNDRYEFYLHNLIEAWRGLVFDDLSVITEGFKMLDGVLLNLKNKIKAEEEIKKALVFTTKWGEAIALETSNRYFLNFSEIQGYVLSLIKEPKVGGVRIQALPDSKVDLTNVYLKIKKIDPDSDWFLHINKKMLLNESSVKKMKPTKLSLTEIMEILKNE